MHWEWPISLKSIENWSNNKEQIKLTVVIPVWDQIVHAKDIFTEKCEKFTEKKVIYIAHIYKSSMIRPWLLSCFCSFFTNPMHRHSSYSELDASWVRELADVPGRQCTRLIRLEVNPPLRPPPCGDWLWCPTTIEKRLRRRWRTDLWRLRGRWTWALEFFIIFLFFGILFVKEPV